MIQANLLTLCPELVQHTGTDGAAALATLITWAGQYRECAERHKALCGGCKAMKWLFQKLAMLLLWVLSKLGLYKGVQ